MCGRYNILPRADAWVSVLETFGEAVYSQLRALQPLGDVRPSTLVPVICWPQGEAGPRMEMMRWGLVPHFWKADRPQAPEHTFNARIESMPGGAMWWDSIRYTRALMPGSSWIEWQKQTDSETGEALKDPRTRRPMKIPNACGCPTASSSSPHSMQSTISGGPDWSQRAAQSSPWIPSTTSCGPSTTACRWY